jgi:hypothetical protein
MMGKTRPEKDEIMVFWLSEKKASTDKETGETSSIFDKRLGRRGPVCDEGQLEVVDDAVHHGIVGKESDNLHRAAALGTDHRVDFINFTNHLSPALGAEGPELVSIAIRRNSLWRSLRHRLY